MIVIISVGYAPKTKDLHFASIAKQVGNIEHRHIFIDDALQPTRKGAIRNQWEAVATCDPSDIIVILDGDDEFAHPNVLSTFNRLYEDPEVWLTYGSFVHSDGHPGYVRPYLIENYRASPWLASHPKTFRAWLAQKVDLQDLLRNGVGRRCADMAFMFPMLEMAGQKHSRYVADVGCIYHSELSFEYTATAEGHAEMRDEVISIRSLPHYEKLDRSDDHPETEIEKYIAAWDFACLQKQIPYPPDVVVPLFLKALELQPNRLEIYYELCDCLRQAGQFDRAYDYAKRAMNADPVALLREGDFPIYQWAMKDEFALCAFLAGDKEAAQKAWRELLESGQLEAQEVVRITMSLRGLK